MQNKAKTVLSVGAILLFLALIISALVYRATLSTEITDEIFGVANVMSIIQGQRPFYTSWCIQTSWCLIAPFYSLFLSLNNGSKEGIVLFSRLLYIVFILLIAGYVAVKHVKKHNNISYLAIIACISYVPFSIYQVGYNQLAAWLLFLTAFLIDRFWQKKEQLYLWVIPGILMGLACISYATLPVMAVVTALVIAILNRDSGLKKALWFSFGVVTVGCIFVAWILSEAPVEKFLTVLHGIMFHSKHEATKGSSFAWFVLRTFISPFITPRNLKRFIVLLLFTMISFIGHKKYTQSRYSHFKLYVSLMFFNCLVLLYKPVNDLFAFIFWMLTLMWIFFDPNLRLKKYVVYLLIQLGFTLTYALSSNNANCFIGLAVTAMMTAFIAIDALIELSQGKNRLLITMTALLVFSIPGLLNVYRYVYRDENVYLLNTKVERGIYKGLYTTAVRRSFLIKMEDTMLSNTSPSDRICVVTGEPMLYVMSNAKITTPDVWDIQGLEYHFTSAEPLLSYFSEMEIEYPDILIATNRKIEDFFKSDVYEIKQFIRDNYELFLFDDIEGIKMAMWRKKNSKERERR